MQTREFTPEERALLDLLTSGDFVGCEAAREQMRGARHGGDWSPGDPSFHILTEATSAPIDTPDGILPSSDRPVIGESGNIGGVMLWVRDGRIDEFEYYWFDPSDRTFPAIERVTTWDDPRVLG